MSSGTRCLQPLPLLDTFTAVPTSPVDWMELPRLAGVSPIPEYQLLAGLALAIAGEDNCLQPLLVRGVLGLATVRS